MKTLILSSMAAATILSFSACTTVETTPAPAPSVRTSTTTTERSSVVHPTLGTTETRTTRTY